MERSFITGIIISLLLIAGVRMNAQDAQNPWHLIAFENEEEVAFYNIEMITDIKTTGQNVTIVLDNGKEFSHPLATTTFGFNPRKAGTGTANESITTSQWTVLYANGRLHFSTAVNGIAIYTINGALVAQFSGNHSEVSVNLPSGIYIIKASGESEKLLVNNSSGNTVAQPEAKIYTPAPVHLRADEAIKAYWNITADSLTISIEISEVEKFYFMADNSIVYILKDGYEYRQLEDYQKSEFTVESVQVPVAAPIDLTVKEAERLNADNRFAFNMFKEVSVQVGSNTFFSPLSLNMALGMLYNGTSGDTRTEMADVLGMGDFTETEINEYYQKMSQALLNIDPLTEIGIANSIWYCEGFSVKQSFIDINQQYFDATVHVLDFNNPDAADSINQWCAEKTRDKITEIVQGKIPGEMCLINALYFKSQWQYQFDKTYRQVDFILPDNQTKKVNMMGQYSNLPCYEDQYLKCVELPYGNQAFSMVVILPNNSDIEQLIEYLDNDKWQNMVQKLTVRDVSLSFPRFKIECDLPLYGPVKNAGMKRIFIGGLDNISDADLSVSDIKQKTYVEVNEEGTEAAAVTSIFVTGEHVPFSFIANRPFLYLIKEKSTGTILFIGRMDNPNE